MFRPNPIEKASGEFVATLNDAVRANFYSGLTASIIERFVAVDAEIEHNKTYERVHLFKPRKWDEESIGLAVSSTALQHTIATGLVRQTEEQRLRTQSEIGTQNIDRLSSLLELYAVHSVQSFQKPFEIVVFEERIRSPHGHAVAVFSRPLVLIDNTAVKERTLRQTDVNILAIRTNNFLLKPTQTLDSRT